MTFQNLLLIAGAVSLTAIAQLFLKLGMSSQDVQNSLSGQDTLAMLRELASSPNILLGFAMYAVGAVVWLFVLAKLDLSVAYPFVGLGFIVTMLLSILVLQEQVTPARIAGTLLICIGCALVARTA
jgi:multidrug transporter EmrE-like cation transporter